MSASRRQVALDMVRDRIIECFAVGEDLPLCRTTVIAALHATRWVRVGRGAYSEVPDWPVRLAAAKLALEYMIGKPLMRSISATLSATGPEITVEAFVRDILADPKAAGGLIEVIQEHAELAEKARNRQLKQVEPLPEQPPQPSDPQSEGPTR